MILERVEALARQQDRVDAKAAARRKFDAVEAAISRGNLILRPDTFTYHVLLDVNCETRELLMRDVAALQRLQAVQESHGERRTGAESRARRKIAVVMDLETPAAIGVHQHRAHSRMLDLRRVDDILDPRVDDPVFVLEERREMAASDVAI